MDSYDVVIVGSGPAGASTALHLCKLAPALAARTLMLDAAHHPREKICAGGLSQRALAILSRLALPLDVPQMRVEGALLQYDGFELGVDGGGTFGLVVRRNELDALLARTAVARGVALSEGEALVDLVQEAGGEWRLTTSLRTLRARAVVGADGAGSLVRRRAGFPKGRRSTRLLVVETPVPAAETREFIERRLTFDFSVIKEGVAGYYWDFPCFVEGRPHLSRGLFDRNDNPRTRVDLGAVLDRCLTARGATVGAHKRKSFPERELQPSLPLAKRGLLLAGEAAGIDPLIGEGIAQALEYGEHAAAELARGFLRGDLSFRGWRRRILFSALGRTLLGYRLVADRVYGPGSSFWFEMLGKRPVARRALAESFMGKKSPLAAAVLAAREILAFAVTRSS